MFSKWKESSNSGRAGVQLIQRETFTLIKMASRPNRRNALPLKKLVLGQNGVLKDHVKGPVLIIPSTSIVEHAQMENVATENLLKMDENV